MSRYGWKEKCENILYLETQNACSSHMYLEISILFKICILHVRNVLWKITMWPGTLLYTADKVLLQDLLWGNLTLRTIVRPRVVAPVAQGVAPPQASQPCLFCRFQPRVFIRCYLQFRSFFYVLVLKHKIFLIWFNLRLKETEVTLYSAFTKAKI